MMVVSILVMDQTLTAGSPGNLFEGSFVCHSVPLGLQYYDISTDGNRFLVMGEEGLAECQINIARHWFEELMRLVPAE